MPNVRSGASSMVSEPTVTGGHQAARRGVLLNSPLLSVLLLIDVALDDLRQVQRERSAGAGLPASAARLLRMLSPREATQNGISGARRPFR